MITIYKYTANLRDTEIKLPVGATFIACKIGEAAETYTLWAIVDTNAVMEVRNIQVVGTGTPLPERGAYLGTFFDDPYVWHLIEIEEDLSVGFGDVERAAEVAFKIAGMK